MRWATTSFESSLHLLFFFFTRYTQDLNCFQNCACPLSPLSVHPCSRHKRVVLWTKRENLFVGQHLVGSNKAVNIAPKELHWCFFSQIQSFWNRSSQKNPEALSWALKTRQINSWEEEWGRSKPQAEADERWPICKSKASEFALPWWEDTQLPG